VVRYAKLQSSRHHQQTNTQLFTGWMPFLSPHQRYHSTEGKSITFHELAYTKLTWGLLMLSLTTGQGVPSFSSAACVDTWWAASWCTVIQSQYVTSNMVLPLTLYPTPTLKSLYWVKIKQCIHYKLLFLLRIKLSTMQNLCTSMISSPFNPPEKTRPSSVLTLAQPSASSSSLKNINRSSPYTSSGLQNRLPNSFHFISQVLITLLYTLFIPLVQVYPHNLHHLSLHHSFTPGSKPIFSTNPFPIIDFWYPPDCLHMDSNYPRRARSAIGVDIVFTLDVCLYVSALERKRLIGMT